MRAMIVNMIFDSESINKARNAFVSKNPCDGKRGPFYNGEQFWTFDKENLEMYKNAVWQGYLDVNRTMKGISKYKKSKNEGAFLKLAEALKVFFTDRDPEFRHDCWCYAFVNNMKADYGYDVHFGQAQKVVNMAFKYLYCCNGASDYLEKFRYCEMPIDSIILRWFFDETGDVYKDWSKFNDKEYKIIANQIKTICEEELKNKNQLDLELVIWDTYKKQLAQNPAYHCCKGAF